MVCVNAMNLRGCASGTDGGGTDHGYNLLAVQHRSGMAAMLVVVSRVQVVRHYCGDGVSLASVA
jgi:hypothetical protein